jgi:hypothetical protein
MPCPLASLSALLLLLASNPSPADDTLPSLDDAQTLTHEVQVLGWSKDERRFALRVYEVFELEEEEGTEEIPYCEGYVDSSAKTFRGGLSILLYEGSKRIGGWRIQDVLRCTPPETARARLKQTRTTLEAQGINLTAAGATLTPAGHQQMKPSIQRQGDKQVTRLTASVTLPQGPWARRTLEVDCQSETVESTREEDEGMGKRTSTVSFELRAGSGKSAATLREFRLTPVTWSSNMAGFWRPGFNFIFLSPSGRRLVVLASATHGRMRGFSRSSVLLGVVDLPERPGPQPRVLSAPAR